MSAPPQGADHSATCCESPSLDPSRKLLTLREKLFTIGVKVVRHGCYITLQMAEVAILKTRFVEILRLIDRLRPAPLPP